MKTHLLTVSSIPASYSRHTLSIQVRENREKHDSKQTADGVACGGIYNMCKDTLKHLSTFAPTVPISP